jgi:dTDP-4-dehydrorhamnose 3,5-epimerase
MEINKTHIEGVMLVKQRVFEDARGYFMESWNEKTFNEALGMPVSFVQDNFSSSKHGVLRGLHYQLPNAQGKLVRVTSGQVFDIVVDVREDSKTFGKSLVIELSSQNNLQLWIPEGIAHGFLVTSERADFLYKVTSPYDINAEHCIIWNDEDLNVQWPLHLLNNDPIISDKDKLGLSFKEAIKF